MIKSFDYCDASMLNRQNPAISEDGFSINFQRSVIYGSKGSLDSTAVPA